MVTVFPFQTGARSSARALTMETQAARTAAASLLARDMDVLPAGWLFQKEAALARQGNAAAARVNRRCDQRCVSFGITSLAKRLRERMA